MNVAIRYITKMAEACKLVLAEGDGVDIGGRWFRVVSQQRTHATRSTSATRSRASISRWS